jgi:iron complex outermembrane receptor protein
MVPKHHLIHLGAAVAGILAASAAFAQQAQEPGADGVGRLEEIIVTAEKRETSEQRTAIAMTVASGEDLARNGITDVNSITNIAPTLQIGQNNANTLITVRGVSSQNFTETGDPAVAINMDNFYLQRAFAVNAALFDIERIEALRGPQGTLYGRNATAGALNIQSVKPKHEFGADASVELGDRSLVRVDGAVNVPVSDTLALRFAGTYRKRDGYRNNAPLKDGDDEDAKGGRIHALWEPTPELSVLLTGEFIRLGGVGPVLKRIPTGDVNADGTLKIGSDSTWALNNPGYTNIDVDAFRTAVSYDFGAVKLSYFGGVQKSTLNRDNDQDGGLAANFGFQQNEDLKDQNHELRLSSNGDGDLRWQVGAYYFKSTNDLLTYFQVHGATPPPFNFFTFDYDVGNESKAAFAQAAYKVTPAVEVELGLRYTKDEKSQVGRNDLGGVKSNLNNHVDNSQVTWHAGVNWQATDDSLVYAKVDKGFKSGGFTSTSNYGPETLLAYEVGTKNRFRDDTVQVNASAFYYDYDDLQVNQINPNNAQQFTLNAGTARIQGLELESVWLATPDTRLDVNVAWLDTKFTNFCTVTTKPCPAANDLSGNELTQAPELATMVGVQHTFEVLGGKLTPRLQSRYQAKTWFTITNSRAEMQESYTKSDLLVTYEPDSAQWTLTLYGRNLEDSTILTSAGFAGYANGYLLQFGAPRTYGARLDVRF